MHFSTRVSVVLVNLGGPLSSRMVQPFIANVLADPFVLPDVPKVVQSPLARFVAGLRSQKVRNRYSRIGGRSTIVTSTLAQGRQLHNDAPELHSVRVAMRHAEPTISSTISELSNDDEVDEIVVVPLYPQRSNVTTVSAWERAIEANCCQKKMTLRAPAWNIIPEYVDDSVDRLLSTIERHSLDIANTTVIFVAHSVPSNLDRKGDLYRSDTEEEVRLIQEQAGIVGILAYQSAVGPISWLGPHVRDVVATLETNAVIMPISFVTEGIETLYELDIELREVADSRGIQMHRVPTIDDRAFSSILRAILSCATSDDAVDAV